MWVGYQLFLAYFELGRNAEPDYRWYSSVSVNGTNSFYHSGVVEPLQGLPLTSSTYVYVRACVRACVRAYVRACVRACVRTYVRMYICMYVCICEFY